MFKYLLCILLAMFPAAAYGDTLAIVSPGTLVVHKGDILVTSKPLVETLNADNVLTQRYASGWIDRMTGKAFTLSTGTKLKALGPVTGGYIAGGYTYELIDGESAAVVSPFDFGVNISGCTFVNDGALCPTVASVNQYIDKGFTIVRFSFKASQMANPAIRAKVVAATEAAISRNVKVVLDRHDYDWPAVNEQVAFWVDLMASMPKSDLIIIDPMNEPRNFNDPVLTNDWDQWARDINPIILGMRENGITNTIAAEFPGWSATFRVNKGESATKASESALVALDRAGGFTDPLNKTILNGHRYFDNGSSGTSTACVGAPGFDKFAEELRKRNLKGIITESAFGRVSGIPTSCVATGEAAVSYLKANSDVIVGVTWWGGGSGWKEDYLFKVEPVKGTFATAPNSDYLNRLLGN